MTSHEYQSFQVLSNIMQEYSGIFLGSVARHMCCASFMFFGIVINLACFSQLKGHLILTEIGVTIFVAGFLITFQESRVVQILRLTSLQTIQRLKNSKSKYESLKAYSFKPILTQFGWIMYTFDVPQFLTLMQYLFDKVIIFGLLYC